MFGFGRNRASEAPGPVGFTNVRCAKQTGYHSESTARRCGRLSKSKLEPALAIDWFRLSGSTCLVVQPKHSPPYGEKASFYGKLGKRKGLIAIEGGRDLRPSDVTWR